MHSSKLPLNALRAFEAAARHLSFTKAAEELHVTAGALSHLIRGLEQDLEVKLFERRVRSVLLTEEGRELYPGLKEGFARIGDAVRALGHRRSDRALVVSTPPGLTSKWLAPRLYRFSTAHPEIDVRISSSAELADFKADGVDLAVRMLPNSAIHSPELQVGKLIDVRALPVCSPRLLAGARLKRPLDLLKRAPLIHDESWKLLPSWSSWLERTGIAVADPARGLRFTSADHALDAVGEGIGVLLTLDVLAYDDLRSGRLVAPFGPPIEMGGAYHIVYLRSRSGDHRVQAFRIWLEQEAAAVDWSKCPLPSDRLAATKQRAAGA